MELMANSDNVLRGGLTSKHVDVKELLNNTHFEGELPLILEGQSEENGQSHFTSLVPCFSLTKIELYKKDNIEGQAGSIEFCS